MKNPKNAKNSNKYKFQPLQQNVVAIVAAVLASYDSLLVGLLVVFDVLHDPVGLVQDQVPHKKRYCPIQMTK